MEIKKEAWRDLKYSQKFMNAFRGIIIVFKTTKHIWIHVLGSLLAVCLGFYFNISGLQWIAVFFAIGFVFVSESFNTAIEIDIDLTSPEYHPYARDTKDVAAAAVLLSACVSIIVGLIIFLPLIIAKVS